MVASGYIFFALENSQISISCLRYALKLPCSLREIISICASEAVWLPDLSLLDLDLECQRNLINDHNAIGDCGQLSSVSGVYRILNETSYLEFGSLVEFQCVDTPYEIDPLFTTECQGGQWNPHPRDICDQLQGVTVIEYGYAFHDYLNFYIMQGRYQLLHLWEQ